MLPSPSAPADSAPLEQTPASPTASPEVLRQSSPLRLARIDKQLRARLLRAPLVPSSWLLPFVLWLAFGGAVVARSRSFAAWTKPRWDGEHYVSIAAHGYRITHCGNPPVWCGNPWFPGWSYFNEAIGAGLGLRALGVSFEKIFVGTAAAGLLALLVLLFRHALVFMKAPHAWAREEKEVGLWTCVGLLCQPGGFYLLTHFPYTFVLLTALLFRILTTTPERLRCSPRFATGLGALAAFWSSLSYPTVFLFALYPFAGFVSERRYRDVRRWLQLAAWIAVFFSGTLCVCLIFYFKFGMFWLYFVHQAQYPRAAPLVNTVSVVVDLLRAGNENERLTFLWYAFGFSVICLRLGNAYREPSLWFAMLVLLFFPMTGSWIDIYRYYLLASPMFVLLGATSCSRGLKAAYLATGLILQFQILYPKYLNGELM